MNLNLIVVRFERGGVEWNEYRLDGCNLSLGKDGRFVDDDLK